MSDNSDADCEVSQGNIQIMGLDIHNPVFAVSGLTIIAFVFFLLISTSRLAISSTGCAPRWPISSAEYSCFRPTTSLCFRCC